jgi:hypothetical protein
MILLIILPIETDPLGIFASSRHVNSSVLALESRSTSIYSPLCPLYLISSMLSLLDLNFLKSGIGSGHGYTQYRKGI